MLRFVPATAGLCSPSGALPAATATMAEECCGYPCPACYKSLAIAIVLCLASFRLSPCVFLLFACFLLEGLAHDSQLLLLQLASVCVCQALHSFCAFLLSLASQPGALAWTVYMHMVLVGDFTVDDTTCETSYHPRIGPMSSRHRRRSLDRPVLAVTQQFQTAARRAPADLSVLLFTDGFLPDIAFMSQQAKLPQSPFASRPDVPKPYSHKSRTHKRMQQLPA